MKITVDSVCEFTKKYRRDTAARVMGPFLDKITGDVMEEAKLGRTESVTQCDPCNYIDEVIEVVKAYLGEGFVVSANAFGSGIVAVNWREAYARKYGR